jgi:uncharacterized protein YecT (DUF1311 family)
LKSKFIISLAFLLLPCLANASITPVLNINKESICGIYLEAYKTKLNQENELSFDTKEIISHKNNEVYVSKNESTTPVTFTKPFIHEKIKWLEWDPIVGLKHSFKWGGGYTDISAISSIPFSDMRSLVFNSYTIGWRGPYFNILLIDNAELDPIISGADTSDENYLDLKKIKARHILPSNSSRAWGKINNLFTYENDFYFATNDTVEKITNTDDQVVCKIGVETNFKSKQLSALENIANNSLMTKGVTHISGYYGSMGNQHHEIKDGFSDAIGKPWLMKLSKNGQCANKGEINNCEKNNRVDFVLNDFAKSDPWSYREAQTIKQHMTAAKYVLQGYYRNLGLSELKSAGIANQAVYDFIYKTVSLHPIIKNGTLPPLPTENTYTLDDGVSVIPKNWYNKTSLMWAAHFNDYDAVNRLLRSSFDVNQVTSSSNSYASIQRLNRSALTYANENASSQIIELLLNNGADDTIIDSTGNKLNYYLSTNPNEVKTLFQMPNGHATEITPSFDCAKARSDIEKAICQSKGLSIYDKQLGDLYSMLQRNNKLPELKQLQRNWLKATQLKCSGLYPEKIASCLKVEYRPRIRFLQNLLNESNVY